MNADIERNRLLRTVESGRDIEELVAWKIPYERLLSMLRSLLAEGLITMHDERLVLTELGHEALATPTSIQTKIVPDPLQTARMPSTQPDDVHIAVDELE